jgi:hypothetical protein
MTARAVCGCPPVNVQPAPRDPVTIAQELADAAERLDTLAQRFFGLCDEIGESETFELDALGCGIRHAACELRARHRAQGADHD